MPLIVIFRKKIKFYRKYAHKNEKIKYSYVYFLHKYLTLTRSTGIEAVSTLLKAFILKGFSYLLAKNTPIVLGFRDREILRQIFARFLCFLQSTGFSIFKR